MKAAEAIQFDTHKFVKHLTENGFTEQQAEVLAEEQVNLLNTNLATKADIFAIKREITDVKRDIEVLRQETKADIESLRLALKADIEGVKGYIEAVRADLLKWMFGMMLAGIGLVVTLVKFL